MKINNSRKKYNIELIFSKNLKHKFQKSEILLSYLNSLTDIKRVDKLKNKILHDLFPIKLVNYIR